MAQTRSWGFGQSLHLANVTQQNLNWVNLGGWGNMGSALDAGNNDAFTDYQGQNADCWGVFIGPTTAVIPSAVTNCTVSWSFAAWNGSGSGTSLVGTAKYSTVGINIQNFGAPSGGGPNWGNFTFNNYSVTNSEFFNTYFGLWTNTSATFVKSLTLTYGFTLPAPSAVTGSASGVNAQGATLNATVDPNTATATYPVKYYWEWGPSPSFGTRVPANQVDDTVLTGTGVNSVQTTLNGLNGGQTYYYRIVAYNADQTSTGATQQFFTSGVALPFLKLAGL